MRVYDIKGGSQRRIVVKCVQSEKKELKKQAETKPPKLRAVCGEKKKSKSVVSQTCRDVVMWAPELIYLQGKPRVTHLNASDREVINYLSVNHPSALGATANHKLTLNLTRNLAQTHTVHICTLCVCATNTH